MNNLPIGIDLGTTHSCIGVYRNNQVEIIPNDQGNRTTPSVVAFDNGERLIGEPAKNKLSSNPEQTVFDTKRLIGKHFSDTTVQQDIKHWPFKLVQGENDKPMINANDRLFAPEEISAMILTKLKESAETYLGTQIKDVVITVPAYFNDSQRRATVDAGAIAGLNVTRIINEPTAAALAYGLNKSGEKMVLIFDYGGGTTDISILRIYDGLFEVKATCGNTHLGGEDIDNHIVTHCLKEFKKKNPSIDTNALITNKKTLGRLKTASEHAKKTLSSTTTTTIEIDSLFQNIDFRCNLTRAKLEDLCELDFAKCFEPITQVLTDASLTKNDITDIVLIGGSTRIPKIREMLKNYFGKEPKKDINPDEAVAYGATIHAAVLTNAYTEMNQLVLLDVTPLSLGIETAGGVMSKIINRNDTMPCSKHQTFSTYSDNQPSVTIKVYEGEREFTKHNNLLGTFELTGIPPMARGIPKINVKFEIDNNGILHVSATEESSLKTSNIVIKNDKNRLTPEQLANMIADAQKYDTEDKLLRDRILAKNEFDNYVYGTKSIIADESVKQKLSEESYKLLSDYVQQLITWTEENVDGSQEEYKQMQDDAKKIISEYFVEVYRTE